MMADLIDREALLEESRMKCGVIIGATKWPRTISVLVE